MSHTPLPWEFSSNIIVAAEIPIAIVQRNVRPSEVVANTRLIAAAPEMYEALKDAEAMLKMISNGQCLQSILLAIAKVEGT